MANQAPTLKWIGGDSRSSVWSGLARLLMPAEYERVETIRRNRRARARIAREEAAAAAQGESSATPEANANQQQAEATQPIDTASPNEEAQQAGTHVDNSASDTDNEGSHATGEAIGPAENEESAVIRGVNEQPATAHVANVGLPPTPVLPQEAQRTSPLLNYGSIPGVLSGGTTAVNTPNLGVQPPVRPANNTPQAPFRALAPVTAQLLSPPPPPAPSPPPPPWLIAPAPLSWPVPYHSPSPEVVRAYHVQEPPQVGNAPAVHQGSYNYNSGMQQQQNLLPAFTSHAWPYHLYPSSPYYDPALPTHYYSLTTNPCSANYWTSPPPMPAEPGAASQDQNLRQLPAEVQPHYYGYTDSHFASGTLYPNSWASAPQSPPLTY